MPNHLTALPWLALVFYVMQVPKILLQGLGESAVTQCSVHISPTALLLQKYISVHNMTKMQTNVSGDGYIYVNKGKIYHCTFMVHFVFIYE